MSRDPSFLSDVETMRGIIDAVPHPIFVKDPEGRFVIVNAAMCDFMGHRFDELVGKLDEDFVPKDQAAIFRENDRRVLHSGEINESEEPFSNDCGEHRTIVTRKSRFVLSGGEPLLIGCITDISDFRRAEAAIRHHAEHDHLTGLPNRLLFMQQLHARQRLAHRGLHRFGQEGLGDQIGGLRPLAGQQLFRIGGDEDHRNVEARPGSR